MEASRLLLPIFCVILLLVVGDNVSTYYCLTIPSDTFQVVEVNPLSRWLFQKVGLTTGLVLNGIYKGILMVPLYRLAKRSESRSKVVLFMSVVGLLIMSYANYNNWSVYYSLLAG